MIVFEENELDKEVSEDIRRSLNRLYRNINGLMNKNIEIKEWDDPNSKVKLTLNNLGKSPTI